MKKTKETTTHVIGNVLCMIAIVSSAVLSWPVVYADSGASAAADQLLSILRGICHGGCIVVAVVGGINAIIIREDKYLLLRTVVAVIALAIAPEVIILLAKTML